jgi:hypothetical protein
MIDRDISLAGVKAADDVRCAARALLMLGRPASKQWNQASTDEFSNGQARFGGERLEGLSLVIGQLNLCPDHLSPVAYMLTSETLHDSTLVVREPDVETVSSQCRRVVDGC